MIARRYMALVMASLLMMQPLLLHAQPTSAPTSAPSSQPVILQLPPGTRLALPQGTFQGYSLDEFKVLLRIHADYRAWAVQIPLLEGNAKQYQELTENLAKQLKLQGEESTVLKAERERLFEKWKEENRLRHLAENKVSWTSWFAWVVAGAATLTATVLGVILAVKD